MSPFKEKILRWVPWTICLAYAGLFFDVLVSNITLAILLICCLLVLNLKTIRESLKSNRAIQLIILFYLLHIVGVLYSQNFDNALFVLEKKAVLLIVPLFVFPAIQLLSTKEKSNLIFNIGALTLISALVLLVRGLLKEFILSDNLAFDKDHYTSIHYVFYSIYFSAGSLLFLQSVSERIKAPVKKIVVISALALYSLGMLVIISSKTGIGAYALGLTYFLYKNLPSRRMFYISSAGVLLCVVLFIMAYPRTLDRFLDMRHNLSILKEDKLTEYETFTGLNLRLFFWKTAITEVWNDKLVFGAGTGDGQDYLNQAYTSHHLDQYGYLNFDPHNQWFATFIQLGFPGLILLLMIFIYAIKISNRNLNPYFIYFAWITLCFSLSESILESNKGIVFFALMMTVLLAFNKEDSTSFDNS
ncbi:MAG: O-antigen ligase family protein [Cyclobacteriaceae bacterium]|nr:O-antigen ligase family protein [Cyclobacteriaceae bacterium]